MSKKGNTLGAKSIKAVFLGDHLVGKTALIHRYAQDHYPQNPESIQPMLATSVKKMCDNQEVTWGLWDTKGTADFENIRPLAFHETQLVFFCFSLDSRESFENVEKKHAIECQKYGLDSLPTMLVGLKSDLPRVVTNQEVLPVAQRLQCAQYVEVSAWTGQNVDKVFLEGMKAFFFPVVKKKTGKKK